MATRKITIEFTGNPTVGNAFSYNILIGGVNLVYPNTLNTLNLDYVSGANVAYTAIGIKSTMTLTIDATLNFLQTYFTHPNITYSRVDDTIEVLINIDGVTITYPDDANDEVLINDAAYDPNLTLKLKYFIEWKDVECIDYLVRIYQKGYTGTATQVRGYGVLKYGSSKTNLDPIRGNGLDLNLEASNDLTLEDLYSEEENNFTVKMYRKNKLLFDGFLKPDGVYQSFVYDSWVLNLTCVDGLGILKDLAFVQPNGLHWVGKMKAIDIIYKCLVRTNLSMNINTSVNIYYEGLTPSDTLDPLTQIYMSVERFVKDDNDTIMDCNDVLTSVLNLFNANICQVDGQWYIYRANELYDNHIVKFRQYSKTNNAYIQLNTRNLGFNLGSHIDNYYPHHAGGNQQIEIEGSVSASRINYKYGFLKSISSNKNLNHTGLAYENWTVLNPSLIVIDPLKNQGLLSTPIDGGAGSPINPLPLIQSENLALSLGDTLNIRIKVQKTNLDEYYFDPYTDEYFLPFFVQRFKIVLTNGTTTYNIKKFGEDYSWDLATNFIDLQYTESLDYSVPIAPLPIAGNIYIILYQNYVKTYRGADPAPEYTNAEVTLVDFINQSTVNANTGAVGEFHTVQRQNRPSSISKETTKIYNGDSPTIIYEGAVLKNDNVTPTSLWFRRGKVEIKPILRLAGEDNLRMSQKPAKVFSGDIYGFMPYLSVISINNLVGKFMPIEWSFDAKSNITSVKLLEAFNDELNDIDYKYTLDYGTTTKPTITS
jgi:hypothetical protein